LTAVTALASVRRGSTGGVFGSLLLGVGGMVGYSLLEFGVIG